MRKVLRRLTLLLIVAVLVSGIASAADLKDGLVAYWPLDSNGNDVVGDSKGKLEGGAKWTQKGRINGAVELDGTTGHVAISDFELTTTELTSVAWLNGWKQADWAGIVCSRGPTTFWMGFTASDTLSYVWNNDAAETWDWRDGATIPENEWAMVAITIDADKAVSYIYTDADGLKSGVNDIPHIEQTISDNLKIGRDECCGDNRHISGILDEVMIYDRALAEDEIMALAISGLAVAPIGKLTITWGTLKQR